MSDDLELSMTAMLAELEKDKDFMPSEFWQNICKKNIQMIKTSGMQNFKRTISNNYFNWMIYSMRDPQFRNVVLTWLRSPRLSTFFFRFEGERSVQTVMENRPAELKNSLAWRYGLFVSMLWDLGCKLDRYSLLSEVSEPEIGNPLRISRDGKLISQDLVNSAMELNQILSLYPSNKGRLKIAEFGAGYGRLAHLFSKTHRGQYFIFDIPPALYVSQWYLEKTFPQKRIFRFRPFSDWSEVAEEAASAEIGFFTSNQLTRFPRGYFDVVTSISTLPEMSIKQVRLFLDLFAHVAGDYIFLKQWSSWKNPVDGTDLSMADYDLGKDWRMIRCFQDPINPAFFNGIWNRVGAESSASAMF
ncbi:MAG: putative sugar O-methyltransferase [Roseomonas sp.]|nr:putative sugar O-methyltransferase [Roseomonas sp.]MCA3380530.1 putative sugar O-methyltransferase [Roseomonas sp.]